MNLRMEDVEAFARALDRILFREPSDSGPVPAGGHNVALALASYLNDSFPRVALPQDRRERLQRRLMRRLGIPMSPSPSAWQRLETEMNRRLSGVDRRWTRLAGPAALVLLGLVGVAYWRQRSAIKAVPAGLP